MKNGKSIHKIFVGMAVAALILIAAGTFIEIIEPFADDAYAQTNTTDPSKVLAEEIAKQLDVNISNLTPEQRMALLEKTLESIRVTSEKAEGRTYYTKLVSGELLKYMRIIAVILLLIAVGFPLTLWLLSRKRLIGLSGLSSEVAATLVVVEERQAKLANILKDIQGEIDYLHTMSVPDLKNLIQQAEAYLKQNETDLQNAGLRKSEPKK